MLTTTAPVRAAFVAALVMVCLAFSSTALAARGGGGGKPSRGSTTISLVLLQSTDGLAHWGQTITFNVATTATSEPFVNLKCYQGGTLVAEGWEGFFAGSLDDQIMGLASPRWTSGDAECTAYVTKPDRTVLGSTSFHVYA